jgi:RNA polymerase sigma factor (sigma-70 family)
MIRREATDPTDEQWVRALQRREEWAWERLHQRTLEPLFAYIFRHCARREDAEDITAEVYAAAVASIDRFRGEASVLTWLIGIARRRLADAARRRGRRPELLAADLPDHAADMAAGRGREPPAVTESPEDALQRREAGRQVRRLVLSLPDAQREAILLHCVEDLPLAEVAHVLGRTENAVKGLLRRARLALLQRLPAEPTEPSNPTQEPHHAGPLSSLCPPRPTPPAE